VRFIAEHADRSDGGLRWGVEPICAVLTEHGYPIAPSTYYDARTSAECPSRRPLRDAELKAHITRVHEQNYGVYGARKVWLQLNREGVPVARCTVERLMCQLGFGRSPPRPATSDHSRRRRGGTRPADLVGRDFNPPAPNRTWVADFERHEALLNRVEVGDLHRRVVAAAR
jgi:putative transposase